MNDLILIGLAMCICFDQGLLYVNALIRAGCVHALIWACCGYALTRALTSALILMGLAACKWPDHGLLYVNALPGFAVCKCSDQGLLCAYFSNRVCCV